MYFVGHGTRPPSSPPISSMKVTCDFFSNTVYVNNIKGILSEDKLSQMDEDNTENECVTQNKVTFRCS